MAGDFDHLYLISDMYRALRGCYGDARIGVKEDGFCLEFFEGQSENSDFACVLYYTLDKPTMLGCSEELPYAVKVALQQIADKHDATFDEWTSSVHEDRD